ncbi:OmpA family protein [Flavobacterium sp.]|uniref:OmpA family protein n=1 Tax=Flavobacterium sp. TaxID=239 RepID=UPI0037538E2F
MKNTFLGVALLSCIFATAQDKTKNEFNRWSIEVNAGNNKGVKPYSTGYYSSDPTVYFNFNGVKHYDIGTRYMVSPIFGFKIDIAFDIIDNQAGSGSLPFETKQYRFGLQGVANLARVFQFESFTKRFGLLAHTGVQVAKLRPQTGINKGVSEDNGGIIIGLTPQLRISKGIVITGDFSAVSNVRQHLNWDGQYAATDNNLSGLLYNTSLGLTFYVGNKDKKHADWYIESEETNKVDTIARIRLDNLEKLMKDMDKDGIPDYLDQENNTPAGINVDSRGRYIDNNKNGVPDDMERKVKDGLDGQNNTTIEKIDVLKELMNKGYLNIFYDVNNDNPNVGSTNNVYNIIQFLRQYPNAIATLTGYADISGNESKNKNLSLRRAQKLFSIITSCGIDKSRVNVEAIGIDTSYPVNPKTGLDLARRVSVTIKNN